MIFDKNYVGVLENGLEYCQDGAQRMLEHFLDLAF